MKSKSISMFSAAVAASASLIVYAHAGDIIKVDNTIDLSLGTSWSGGTAPGTSDIAVWNNTVAGANSTLLGGDLSWAGIRIADPGGLVTIGGANTLTLGTPGIDMSAATQSLVLNNNVTLGAAQAWNVNSGKSITLNGALTGAFTLTKSGLGSLTLAQTSGTVNSNLAVSAGLLGVNTGTGTVTYSGTITGSGSLTKSGTGTMVLNNAGNTFSGTLTISQGRLQIDHSNALQSGVNLVLGDANSGTGAPNLYLNSTTPTIGTLAVGSDAAIHTNSWAANVSGVTTLNNNSTLSIIRYGGNIHSGIQTTGKITGTGNLIFEYGGSGNFYWQANNTVANDFTGDMRIKVGQLRLQVSNSGVDHLSRNASLTIDTGATFSFSTGSAAETIVGLNGGGSVDRIAGTASVLTVGYNNGGGSFSGTLSGISSLIKTGSGTQVFSGGGLNFTGATSVTGGLLKVQDTTYFSSQSVSISSGAALEWNRTTNVNMAGSQQFTGAGVLQKTGAGMITIGINGGSKINLSAGGVLDVQGGDLNIGWGQATFGTNQGGVNLGGSGKIHNSDTAMKVDWLTGTGELNNAYNANELALTIGGSNTTNNATYGVAGNTATFSGTLGKSETYNGVGVQKVNVTKTGTGTQILMGTGIVYTGATTVNNGKLTLENTTAFNSSGVTINGGALEFKGTGFTYNKAITLGANGSSNPTLLINASGMTLGALTVPAGVTGATISMTQNSATWSHTIAGATLGSALNVNQSNVTYPNWNQITWSSKITGTGGGAGNDTLVFNNTGGMQNYFTTNAGVTHDFSGNIHVKAGVIAIQSGNPGGNLVVPDASMLIIDSSNAGEWRWNNGGSAETLDGLAGAGTMGNPGNVTLTINSANTSNDGNRNFSGSLGTMGGVLTKTGSGTQTFSGTGINYTGATTVNGGRLKLTDATSFASSSVAITSGTLELNRTTGTQNVGSALSGAGTLEKTGNGTVTLTANNSGFTGKTVVSGGMLALGAGGTLGTTNEIALNGGNFNVSAVTGGYTVSKVTGIGSVTGALTVSSELAIGNSAGTVGFENLTLAALANSVFEIGGNAGDLANVTGTLVLNGTLDLNLLGGESFNEGEIYTLFGYTAGNLTGTFAGLADGDVISDAGGDWMIDYDSMSSGLNGGTGDRFVTITAVPEPRAALIGGLGLLALLRRRRNH